MFSKLEVFQTSIAMARHAGSRQALVARNLANADTPGYRAAHLGAFHEMVDRGTGLGPRTTRPGHIAAPSDLAHRSAAAASEPSPNGNSVSLEEEMFASVEAQREHSRALTIYKHGLDILRLSIGRR